MTKSTIPILLLRRRRQLTGLLLGVAAIMLFSLLAKDAMAQSAPALNLPAYPVTAIYTPDSGSPSSWNTDFAGVGNGFDVRDGTPYTGWCVERLARTAPGIDGQPNSVRLYSSYDPNLPVNLTKYGARTIPWDQINWVLNNKGNNSPAAIAEAIWSLEEGQVPSSDPAAAALVLAAQANGSGFVPGPGQVLAVILTNGSGITSTGDDLWQESIIEVPLGAVGDRVWYDQNQNGIQDPNEPGVPNVPVKLLAPGPDGICGTGDDLFMRSTTTDGSGLYRFVVGTPAVYCIQFVPPPGYVISPPNRGDGTNDSKPNPSTGFTPTVPLSKGETKLNQDLGIYVPGSLGDNVQCVSTGSGPGQHHGEPVQGLRRQRRAGWSGVQDHADQWQRLLPVHRAGSRAGRRRQHDQVHRGGGHRRPRPGDLQRAHPADVVQPAADEHQPQRPQQRLQVPAAGALHVG